MLKSKTLGGVFFLIGIISLVAFIAAIWGIFTDNLSVVEVLIPSLKYWAFSELFTGFGIVFFLYAPDQDWSWQELFSPGWGNEEWLPRGIRMLLVGGLLFVLISILLDFGYKLTSSANLF